MKFQRSTRRMATAIVGVSLAATVAMATSAEAATPPTGGAGPGASGSVAAISGSSMEVQSQASGQVSVGWTAATTFSQTVAVAANSVAVGDCVAITGSNSKGTITAKAVSVSQPTNGKCTTMTGFGGARGAVGTAPSGARPTGEGAPPGGTSGHSPSGASGKRPTGFAGGGNFGFATGQVTAVTANELVISGSSSATAQTKSKQKTTSKATTVKVKVAASTTYSEDQSATASNLAVGDCVTASGTSSSTGAVTASMVRITSTGGNTCTTGFGGGGAGG
jgi:hypothetical protein